MNREETLALYEQGVEAWNRWANRMLEEKNRLKNKGLWIVEDDELSYNKPKSETTKAWFKKAEANFSNKENPNTFEKTADFSCFIFPGNTIFQHATFTTQTSFYSSNFNGEADFSNSIFKQYTLFENVTFSNVTTFMSAQFKDEATFSNSAFNGQTCFNYTFFNDYVTFQNTKFTKITEFEKLKFFDNANFKNTSFYNEVSFKQVIFSGKVWFDNSIFLEKTSFKVSNFTKQTYFTSTTFKGYTSFQAVCFEQEANFNAISSESAFTLESTSFKNHSPNFIQANFKEAPRLDNIEFEDDVSPGSFKNSITTFIHPDIKARYQALKRLAVQAHDHENEQRFWAGELRSDRSLKHEDGSWNCRPVFSAFWWGNIAYEFFSDFGRSIVRPLIGLVSLMLLMTCIHIYAHSCLNKEPISTSRTKTHMTKQSDLKGCNIRSSAFRVAAKNGAIGFLQNPAKRSTSVRDYTCLYGTYNDNVTPKVPNSIFWIELFHTLFSVILIFLALLGIRNNFKLK